MSQTVSGPAGGASFLNSSEKQVVRAPVVEAGELDGMMDGKQIIDKCKDG